MNPETSRSPAEWPTAHGYVAKAAPRPGNGWLVRIYAHDPEAPNHARLVATTECATLERLEEKAWDVVHELDASPDVRIVAAPAIDDGLMVRVVSAWKAMADAKRAEADAAVQIREVVRDLRESGLSLADIAYLTHVSRGRVSQLLV